MNLTNLGKGAWLDFSASWRSKGGERLELWLPRNWPPKTRSCAGAASRRTGQFGKASSAGSRDSPGRRDHRLDSGRGNSVSCARACRRARPRKIVQALPFALEEQLIDPPERLHFAFAHEADGELAVAVTRRERMESWLGALAAAGLAPTHLAPVTLSVPLADRSWTLAFVDGEIVLRSGARAGLGGSGRAAATGLAARGARRSADRG